MLDKCRNRDGQPSLDAGQLQSKDMKLAMRVGKSRHYKVSEIQGRYSVETGLAAGFSREQIASIFTEIHTKADQAFARALADMPAGFPETLFASVKQGFEQRIPRLQFTDD
jgi:serine/threonine-protein kinase HipA